MTKIDHWNYRVVAEPDEYGLDFGSVSLIEAYYNKKGKIVAWAKVGSPVGNDTDDLLGELDNMRLALDEPVLRLEDLPGRTTAS